MILFKDEGAGCITSIEKEGYQYFSPMRIAVNDPSNEDHSIRTYETYQYYQKNVDGIVFDIGSKWGRCPIM